jgi:pSer/pThr/pTyr-binding forkhead associated (FHA) protein
VVYPEEELYVAPQPVIRPTVCLSSYQGRPRGILLYQGGDQMADIHIEAKISRIGNGKEADIQIDRDTISKIHARIDREEDCYYIEDLNSTNGTFVNEEPLAYKERRKLNSNDMISFADIRYRFS